MESDRYGNPLGSASADARLAYQAGLDQLLASADGAEESFARAVSADEGFALAHLALARSRRIMGQGGDIATPLSRARRLARNCSSQERSQIHCLGLLLEGDSQAAWRAIKEHVKAYPRDALVVQPTTGVFGLIGFSGRPGREAEHLAWCDALSPHYPDDWWFLGQHGFARVEAGRLEPGGKDIERSLAIHPGSATGAHYHAHLLYESGRHREGFEYLATWIGDCDTPGPLHCHLCWHMALWALQLGWPDRMWDIWQTEIAPEHAIGPPINVLTDGVSLLFRAEIAGISVQRDLWDGLAEYAQTHFPTSGISFVDAHAVLAHARAGDGEMVASITGSTAGTAAGHVGTLARAFEAMNAGDWPAATAELTEILPDHERLGGSRAQRDLIEFFLALTLVRQGRADEAGKMLLTRRPQVACRPPVQDLDVPDVRPGAASESV